ncbi:Lrp/AsnC family transcriptional regulator [Nocardia gipuzkoensis]|uniref:Lrp/AsnC family transcriptional regulator n=1 Tax=Nocardia gipuzkoensis TaxID=2749991 RepID=UPI00237D793D|nr:Lrp/AsnC ligand binding domain-containing protein [Nocardia gipuzkoensis]MDE1672844.1 Lrp/AsnC ligand binding domain-containing protein [Nocardia gipuzkoensis]
MVGRERPGDRERATAAPQPGAAVSSADLDAVGRAMVTHPEIVFVAATTGPSNVFASIICRDTADLYRYVTERLGALDGITGLEVTPSLRVLKQAQTLLDADRITLVR